LSVVVGSVGCMLIAESDVDEVVVSDDFATLQEILAFEPGPTVIAFLNAIDPAELDDAGQVSFMELWERQLSWMAERAVTATAVVCGPTPAAGADDWNTDLVAAALGMTTGGARKRVAVTRAITEQLPACRAALAAGDMSYYHACVVVEAIDGLDADAVVQVDALVAAKVPGQAWVAFRRCLRAAVLRAAPDLAMATHDQAARTRDVTRDWLPDGMGSLYARLTAVETDTVWSGLAATAKKLQAAAKTGGQPDAGIDAYRADALVSWANTALAIDEPPTRHGRRSQVQFITDLPSLLGLADNPGELVGYGPIAASIIRQHAVDADWRRLVVDPVTDTCSTTEMWSTGRHKNSPTSSSPATADAGSPAVADKPPAATSTTTSPPLWVRPRRRTAAACAGDTTGSKPSAAGKSNYATTAPANGPHPTAESSTSTHRPNSNSGVHRESNPTEETSEVVVIRRGTAVTAPPMSRVRGCDP
jgi:Domain of unknown function (DUF222)